MKVRVDVELTKEQALQLTGLAYRCGFQREEPYRAWSERELKEAARIAIAELTARAVADED